MSSVSLHLITSILKIKRNGKPNLDRSDFVFALVYLCVG